MTDTLIESRDFEHKGKEYLINVYQYTDAPNPLGEFDHDLKIWLKSRGNYTEEIGNFFDLNNVNVDKLKERYTVEMLRELLYLDSEDYTDKDLETLTDSVLIDTLTDKLIDQAYDSSDHNEIAAIVDLFNLQPINGTITGGSQSDWVDYVAYLDPEITDLDPSKYPASVMNGYAQWCAGEIYGYIIESITHCPHCDSENTEHYDSLWGIYSDNIEDVFNQAIEYITGE